MKRDIPHGCGLNQFELGRNQKKNTHLAYGIDENAVISCQYHTHTRTSNGRYHKELTLEYNMLKLMSKKMNIEINV